jgi:myo-inositol-1(or 4)-monophosphatase
MKPFHAELALARSTASEALRVLAELRPEAASFGVDQCLPREMKTASDRILEDVILASLRTTGLEILSEETGLVKSVSGDGFRWVVDPLDGTVNFMRSLAPCSVSLALYYEDNLIFGVIGEFPSGRIAWGGSAMGSFVSDTSIRVSRIKDKRQAVICSGFPSRFEFDDAGMSWILRTLAPFAKVRMFGAASLSLLHLASGSAEAYAERDIMIWDVAAGLAILEGAGGSFNLTKSRHLNALNVFASNGVIDDY